MKKREIKCNKITKWCKNDELSWCYKKNIKGHNPNWPQIPGHSYRVLIIGGSGSGKTNSYQICFFAKDPYEAE